MSDIYETDGDDMAYIHDQIDRREHPTAHRVCNIISIIIAVLIAIGFGSCVAYLAIYVS